jgi:hypothetical protein
MHVNLYINNDTGIIKKIDKFCKYNKKRHNDIKLTICM